MGDTLIVTNGCFDTLTVGHVELFHAIAKRFPYCWLHVLVNSDESVRRLKGPTRPWNRQEHRATVLEALRSVHSVEMFDEDTPLEAMQRLQKRGFELIVVKGRGYQAHEIVAPRGVTRYILGEDLGVSSTKMIEKMKNDRP